MFNIFNQKQPVIDENTKHIVFPRQILNHDIKAFEIELDEDYLKIIETDKCISISKIYRLIRYEDITYLQTIVYDADAFITIRATSIADQIDDSKPTSSTEFICSFIKNNKHGFDTEKFFSQLDSLIRQKIDTYKSQHVEQDPIVIKAQVFLTAFKKQYGVDFEQFKADSKSFYCYLENDIKHDSSGEIFINSKQKLFFVLSKDNIDEILEVLSTPKNACKDYYDILSRITIDDVKRYLFGFDDLLDIRFIEDIRKTTIDTRLSPSPLKIALEAEFIHPLFAIADALEGTKPITYTSDFSRYEFLFKTNPFKAIYLGEDTVKSFGANSIISSTPLKELMIDFKIRKANPPMPPIQEEKPAVKAESKSQKTKMERLLELKELLDNSLISQEEFDTAKAEILKD